MELVAIIKAGKGWTADEQTWQVLLTHLCRGVRQTLPAELLFPGNVGYGFW